MSEQGLRFNEGKVRMDLLPTNAIKQMAQVFTVGASKYAPRNWEKGMNWTTVLASLERHIAKFKNGEDFDEETGLLHMAHAMTNCAFLLEYYSIYPQGDDRPHKYLRMPKIGLDIDDVLADFIPAFAEKYNLSIPEHWSWSYQMLDYFKELYGSPETLREFFLGLKPKIEPKDIPFEPFCYLTSRELDSDITRLWLYNNGFPCAPVHSIGHGVSKVEKAKELGIEIFVDDKFENFVELNNAGICCFLFDAPHNQRYNVGHKRIYSLKDIPLFK